MYMYRSSVTSRCTGTYTNSWFETKICDRRKGVITIPTQNFMREVAPSFSNHKTVPEMLWISVYVSASIPRLTVGPMMLQNLDLFRELKLKYDKGQM